MVDDFDRKLDATYTQLNNSIRWMSNCVEILELQVDQISATLRRQERHQTRGERAIRSFVGFWF